MQLPQGDARGAGNSSDGPMARSQIAVKPVAVRQEVSEFTGIATARPPGHGHCD